MLRFLSFKEIDGILYKKKKDFCVFFLNNIFSQQTKYCKRSKTNLLQSKLERDILKNKIYYKNSHFFGTINKQTLASIIKLGGVYDKIYNGYYLPWAALPENLRKIIEKANENYKSFETFAGRQISENIKKMPEKRIVDRVLQDYAQVYDKLKKTMDENNLDKAQLRQEIEQRAASKVRQLKKDISEYVERQMVSNRRRKINPDTYKELLSDGIKYRCGTFIDYIYRDTLTAYQKKVCKLNSIDDFYWLDINYLKGNPNYRHTHGEFTDKSIKGEKFDMNNPPIDKLTGRSVLPSEEPNCSCIAIVDRQHFLKLVAKYKKH